MLRSNYEKACNAYLEEWCKKHEFDIREADWVGGDIGGVVFIADFYVSFEDIMIDIDRRAPRGEYWRYYDYAMDCQWLGISYPNYNHWLRGAPIKSKEEMVKLKRLKNAVDEAKRIFEKAIQ